MGQSLAALPPAHQTMLLAHRAMVRDLDRVARAAGKLAQSPDPAPAAARREYVDKLFQLIDHHHEGEDEFLWPRLRQLGADEEALTLMTTEHAELARLLHGWHGAGRRLGTDAGAAAELASLTEGVREQLARHAGDEERELSGRLAPVLDERVWKGVATHMRKTAPGWTLKFMPAWLSSVAGPDERGGVPAPPVAALFRGWLEKRRRAAFGESF
ncbi:hemerythrin domain-containing protein [Streptomyces sp. Act-28]